MLKKTLSFILMPPLILAIIVFCLHNNQRAQISLWPFPYEIDVPTYFLLFGGFLVGYILAKMSGVFSFPKRKKVSQAPTNSVMLEKQKT